jgi:hypothetical protein
MKMMPVFALVLFVFGMFAMNERKAFEIQKNLERIQQNHEKRQKLYATSIQRPTNRETVKAIVAQQKGTENQPQIIRLSANLFKMIIKYLDPQKICTFAWTSESMKSKIHSIFKPKAHSKVRVHLLALGDVCFPDFTKDCTHVKLLFSSEFTVIELKKNPDKMISSYHILLQKGESEMADYHLARQTHIFPNYFHKVKRADIEIYVIHVNGHNMYKIGDVSCHSAIFDIQPIRNDRVCIFSAYFRERHYFSYAFNDENENFVQNEFYRHFVEHLGNKPFKEGDDSDERVKCLKLGNQL